MARNIKGDLNITRDLTAGRRISADLALNATDWATGTDYLVNDLIIDGGSIYICKATHTSAAALSTDINSWDVVGSNKIVDHLFATGVGYVFDGDIMDTLIVESTSASTGNVLSGSPTNITEGKSYILHFKNTDSVSRSIVLSGAYRAIGEDTGIASFDIVAGYERVIEFVGLVGGSMQALADSGYSNVSGIDDVLALAQPLTTSRTVTLAGSTWNFSGTSITKIKDNALNTAVEWQKEQTTHETSVSGLTVNIDLALEGFKVIKTNDANTGDVIINEPTNNGANKLSIGIVNEDSVSRNYIFDTSYKVEGGSSDIGTITLAAGELRYIELQALAITSPYKLVSIYDTGAVASTGESVQELTAVANVIDWDVSNGGYAFHDVSGGTTTINTPTNMEKGRLYTLNIINTFNNPTISFSSAYRDSSGNSLVSISPESGQDYTYLFAAVSTSELQTLNYSSDFQSVVTGSSIDPSFGRVTTVSASTGTGGSTFPVDNAFTKYRSSKNSGKTVHLYIEETEGINKTITWGNEYIGVDGSQKTDDVLLTGTTKFFRLIPNKDNNKFIVTDLDAPSDGLAQQGILVATLTGKGIYTAEGTNAASALYAASGSQDRVLVSSTLAGVGAVISVQAGDYLNGILNGTYTTQSDGELLEFFDNEAGKWAVQVIGASKANGLVISTLTVPDTNSSLQTLTSGTSGTTYAGARVMTFGNTGEVTNDTTGIFDVVNDYIEFKKAGTYRITARIDIEDAGGSATSGYMFVGDQTNMVRTSILTTDTNWWGRYSFDFIETYAIGDKLDFRATHNAGENHDLRNMDIIVTELPTTETVMAGMVIAKTLAYTEVGVTSPTDAIIAPLDTIVREDVAGAISTDGSTLTVNVTGAFDIDVHAPVIALDPNIVIKVNGTVVKTYVDSSHQGRMVPFRHNFTTGDTLTVEDGGGALANWNSGANNPTTDANYTRIILKQSGTQTVINTADVAVNDQAASGYFDIGTMRMQFGEAAAGTAGVVSVTLPIAMGNANYNIQFQTTGTNTAGTFAFTDPIRTTTGFTINKRFNNSSTVVDAGEGFMWSVKGLH
jgi:hypothetical protein